MHFDSHTDLNDSYFGGYKLTHGTPFRRAIDEGLIDPTAMVQVGIRGTMYDGSDYDYAASVGARLITIEEVRERGIPAVMEEVRAIVRGRATYVTFDIDFIDPAYAPGTGTPEIGGPTSFEAQQCVRALEGVDIVGADMRRGVAALRSIGQHGVPGSLDRVRAPLRDGEQLWSGGVADGVVVFGDHRLTVDDIAAVARLRRPSPCRKERAIASRPRARRRASPCRPRAGLRSHHRARRRASTRGSRRTISKRSSAASPSRARSGWAKRCRSRRCGR